MDPKMLEMMKDFNYNDEELTKQLDSMGMTPQDVVGKIMSDPDLAMAFSQPRVQQAIMEITKNPMAIVNYQSDPEVMKVGFL